MHSWKQARPPSPARPKWSQVLNPRSPDGRCSRAQHTRLTGSPAVTTQCTRDCGRNLLKPRVLAENFSLLGMWLHLCFFSNHWLPRQHVRVCERQRERLSGSWADCHLICGSHKPPDPRKYHEPLVLILIQFSLLTCLKT